MAIIDDDQKYTEKDNITRNSTRSNIKKISLKDTGYSSYSKAVILLICFISYINYISCHVCGFDNYPHKKPEVLQMEINEDLTELEKLNLEQNRFLQTTTSSTGTSFDPIRIYFDYTTLDSQSSNVDPSLISGVKKILTNTQGIFQNILGVKRYNSKLRVRSCDSSITIATEVRNGIDTDLVIFPFFDTSLSNSSTEAYATACIISSVNNRPIAGLIGFSPKFNTVKPNWETYYTNLALHELSHVIVFNPNLFDFFKDSNGNPYNSADVRKTSIVNGLQRNLIAYPKMLAAAKNHFNCNTMEGVELENQGGTGTAASHWESRVMLGDYMIGLSFDDISISEITLALFEDSGWYSVNYYTGGLFKYGKNKGCQFLTNKCINNGVPLTTDEFCAMPYQSLCTSNLLNRGICYITDTANPDDQNYRYFTKQTTGGLFMSDYCPIIAVPTNSTYFYPWSCSDGMSNYPLEFDEIISSNSGCFLSNLLRTSASSKYFSNTYRGICYKFNCDFSNIVLTITIGIETVTCPKEGGVVNVKNYSGNLVCPDFYKICTWKTQCKDLVTCALNKVLPINKSVNYTPVSPITSLTTTSTTSINPTTLTSTVFPVSTPTTSTITPTISNISPVTTTQTTNTTTSITPMTPTIPNNTTIQITINKPPVNYNTTLTKDDNIGNSSDGIKVSIFSSILISLIFLV